VPVPAVHQLAANFLAMPNTVGNYSKKLEKKSLPWLSKLTSSIFCADIDTHYYRRENELLHSWSIVHTQQHSYLLIH